MKYLNALCLAMLMHAASAQAQVTVKDAWVRGTVAQQQATGAFLQLSAAQDSRLLAVSSPLSPQVEIHEMAMENDVMKMRQLQVLDLPAGKTVALKPGGLHLMLMQLKSPLKAGDSVPLSLLIEDRKSGQRQTLNLQVEVRALNAAAAQPAHKH